MKENGTSPRPRIWIDLDNTPHVPFFQPIIEELEARDIPVTVTARDAFQVCALADRMGVRHTKIGKHNGRRLILKVLGLLKRAWDLAPVVRSEQPSLAVSHGSRAQLLTCRVLGIPSLELTDYEHAQSGGLLRPSWLMGPAALSDTRLARECQHFEAYPGYKEDVYAWKSNGEHWSIENLGIETSQIVATVRPPATEAHYHHVASERLFEHFMERATRHPMLRTVLLPRNQKQEEELRQRFPHWFRGEKTIIPPDAIDGMALIAQSDLVVSGGGTMCREAAALGVPAYSIFRGETGAVDLALAGEGRLILVETEEEVDARILLEKSHAAAGAVDRTRQTLTVIVDRILALASKSHRSES